jgi:hypothetical protein
MRRRIHATAAKSGSVKRLALLLLPAFVACSHGEYTPYSTTVGVLQPGSTITVQIASGVLNAYKPAEGDPGSRFTVSATAVEGATPPPAPTIRAVKNGIVIEAGAPLESLLVRVPQGVNLVVQSQHGNVNVTDITGNVQVRAGTGDVKIMIAGKAEASTQKGGIDATIGAQSWTGTLHFSSKDGDVTLFVPEIAPFHAHMHTDDGTLFTDFPLRGTSQGTSETIDAPVNGGTNAAGVDLESKRGAVRLLKLAPQA